MVASLVAAGGESDLAATAARMSQQYAKLAAEHWEYVGPIMSQPTTSNHTAIAVVLFKRTKPR